MKNVLLILLVALVVYPKQKGVSAAPDPNEPLFKGSMLEVREKAQETNRPYIVQFTASWCMPCRWMESTTYKDERVVAFIEENLLAVKVDIDDFDGYAWKEYYGVKALPTMLIFSPQGELLEKREHSLSPSQLLGLLKKAVNGDKAADSQLEQMPARTHVSYLQFGLFTDAGNAQKCYEQVSKSINLPVQLKEVASKNGSTGFVVRSNGISDPDMEMKWIQFCERSGIKYLIKLESYDGQSDHSQYQKTVSRLGSNATL